jgi:hypothetical protein
MVVKKSMPLLPGPPLHQPNKQEREENRDTETQREREREKAAVRLQE